MKLEAKEQERLDFERLMVLSGVTEENPIWRAVQSYAEEHVRNCMESALRPDLLDGQRQFETGRLASADDFLDVLRQLWKKAHSMKR